jgi:hypothetical protein
LPKVASNYYPPTLNLPSSNNYRHEPQHPAWLHFLNGVFWRTEVFYPSPVPFCTLLSPPSSFSALLSMFPSSLLSFFKLIVI